MKIFALILIATALSIAHYSVSYADATLNVRPLEYKANLSANQKQQGFIDISDPQSIPIFINVSIQAFRQTDSRGTLTFYTDERLYAAIHLNETKAEIPPHKTLRLFFTVDSTKLPVGDTFATIFVQTSSNIHAAAHPIVRVGTLLFLENAHPSSHSASLSEFRTPLIDTGSSLKGSIDVKNSAPPSQTNGFFPSLTFTYWPFGSHTVIQGPFVYAGISRTVTFSIPTGHVGLYVVQASSGNAIQRRLILLLPGYWLWVAILSAIIVLIGLAMFVKRMYRKRHVD